MRASLVLVLMVLAAGCVAAPAAQLEPSATATPAPVRVAPAADPLEWTRETYDWGFMVATREDVVAPYPVRLRGSIHLPEGAGPFPVAVLLHGNHGTCRGLLPTFPSVYCGTIPMQQGVPSFAGYDYLAEDLAARGIVVVSIDANDVNDGNALDAYSYGRGERAQLVLRTLEGLRDALGEKVDLQRVGLMGHSRGGEGVLAAAALNRERGAPFGIVAVVPLAPTDFGRLAVHDEALLVILPSCDGDVWVQHGARVYDASQQGSAPLTQVLAMGANHNFYNTEWTWDDGVNSDPYCGDEEPTRPLPEEQRNGSLAYIGGFLRLHLLGDDALAALFDGTAFPDASACAGDDCGTQFHVSHQPPSRLDLETEATGFSRAERCSPSGAREAGFASLLDVAADRSAWCPGPWTSGSNPPLLLEWGAPGGTLAAQVAETTAAYRHVSLRVAVDPDETKGDIELALVATDADGRTAETLASSHSRALFAPPGEYGREMVLNDVLVPLSAFEGVDATRLASLEWRVVSPETGRILVDDAMLR